MNGVSNVRGRGLFMAFDVSDQAKMAALLREQGLF